MQPETISFRQLGCEMYVQQLEKRLVIINISFCIEAGAMAPSNGVGLVPNHRHVNTTLTGGIYRMVQSNSSARWAFEIPSSVVRNRSIARVRHRTHRVLYSSMVAALANFYLVTAFFGLRAKRPRVINTVWLVLPIVVGMGNTTHNSATARPWYGQVDTR